MSYASFKKRIREIGHASGIKVRSVKYDNYDGMFKAYMADGAIITGNPSQLTLTLIYPKKPQRETYLFK